MAAPFISEIRIMSFNFAPYNWAQCNGQLLPINQNQALFSLLGTTYGGDGRQTFGLPNLRGRVPIHMGNGHTLGEAAGASSCTVNIQQLPTHIHFEQATTNVATTNDPSSSLMLGQSTAANLYAAATNLVAMDPRSISNVGGSQPHNNMAPYLVLNFCIALQGIFPSQN